MRVYLVRHARAERESPRGDAARPLTPQGRAAFGALLAAAGPRLAVTRVLSSPFVRARETAELVAAASGAKVHEEPELASGALDGRGILALARRAGAGTALVGHNPEIGQAIALAAHEAREVPPGTVAAVDLDDPPRLVWLQAP